MNVSIVGRKVELTDSIREHIESAFESLKKFNLDIISVSAVASLDEKKGKKGVEIDFTINLPHKETIVIKQKEKDLYAAVDLAIDRAQKVLRRHHDKIVGHRQSGVQENNLRVLDQTVDSYDEEIVPMELELYKPMEIEEAVQRLKDSEQQFLVFNDHDSNMRVLFKRADGRFGLY